MHLGGSFVWTLLKSTLNTVFLPYLIKTYNFICPPDFFSNFGTIKILSRNLIFSL